MIALWRGLIAEQLKLKRTLALWLVLIIPLTIVALVFASSLVRGTTARGTTAWEWFPQLILSLWSLLLLPLFVALEMALLSALESTEKQWKHLFALAIPRSVLYSAKLLIGAGLIGLSTLVLWGGILASGWCLGWLRPALGFDTAIPWLGILQTALKAFLAAWLILALQLWVSLRWHSFTLSVGLGMTATVVGAFLTSSERWSAWYPWSLPAAATIGTAADAQRALLLSTTGGLVVAVVGCWDVVRRDVM